MAHLRKQWSFLSSLCNAIAATLSLSRGIVVKETRFMTNIHEVRILRQADNNAVMYACAVNTQSYMPNSHLVKCLPLMPQWSDTASPATADTVCMVDVLLLTAVLRNKHEANVIQWDVSVSQLWFLCHLLVKKATKWKRYTVYYRSTYFCVNKQ